MLTHRDRIYALGLGSLALLVAVVVLAVLGSAPELAARLEGALGVMVLGFYDSLKARKRVVDVTDADEREVVLEARDLSREQRGAG
jgi:hypothetical protein